MCLSKQKHLIKYLSKISHKKLRKKLHAELFNKVLTRLLYTKSAGHKDSSPNINKAHDNDAKCEKGNASIFLHNHILYYFNKI